MCCVRSYSAVQESEPESESSKLRLYVLCTIVGDGSPPLPYSDVDALTRRKRCCCRRRR